MTPLKFLVSTAFLSVVTGCWQGPSYEGKPLDQWMVLAKDKSAETRKAAAKALGRLGLQTEEVLPTLIDLVKDENPGVQIQAIFALRELSPRAESALPALEKIVGDTNQNLAVRRNAAKTARLIQRGQVGNGPRPPGPPVPLK
jgi:hypothetical protein